MREPPTITHIQVRLGRSFATKCPSSPRRTDFRSEPTTRTRRLWSPLRGREEPSHYARHTDQRRNPIYEPDRRNIDRQFSIEPSVDFDFIGSIGSRRSTKSRQEIERTWKAMNLSSEQPYRRAARGSPKLARWIDRILGSLNRPQRE